MTASSRGTQHASNRRRTRRRGSVANALLVAVCFICGVAIALRAGRTKPGAGDGSDTTVVGATPPSAGDALGTATVKDLAGRTIPLVTAGEPAIIMISSRSCTWCAQTLEDLGAMAHGRPLPRLKLLTLEGAGEGAPMVRSVGLAGVELLGPVGSTDQVRLTFRYPGTPTFLAVNRQGQVVETMPGYPMGDTLRRWFAVMAGDADVP